MSGAPMGGESKSATGTKLDMGKTRFDLVPMRAFTEYGKVLTFGERKYGANNWRKVIGWRWRYIGAGIRHIVSYILGERSDPESGLHHLGHALCCFNFVLENELCIEAGEKVPDGDAIPEKPPVEVPVALPQVTDHPFQARDPLAYGSPCSTCGRQGIDHSNWKVTS